MAPLFSVVRLYYETMNHNNIKKWTKQTGLKCGVSQTEFFCNYMTHSLQIRKLTRYCLLTGMQVSVPVRIPI
jgi:hypothetical protein